jgi:carbon monoxide dehydrogenase subunit G
VKMEHAFTAPTPIEHAWTALLDIEDVASCLPGAEVTGRNGDSYEAAMKLSLGPMRMRYAGQVTIAEADADGHRAVLLAKGTDTRGQGVANAQITMALASEADETRVTVTTELELAGRVAQMGRGIVDRVADDIFEQFASCLSRKLSAPAAASPATAPAPSAPEPLRVRPLALMLRSLRGWLARVFGGRKGRDAERSGRGDR